MTSDHCLLVVSFRLDVEQEPAFSAFLHHQHLPALMAAIPGIRTAWRYQEHHVTGSLKYYRKQFLTLLELESPDAAAAVQAAIGGDAEWRRWCAAGAVDDLDPPCLYRLRWEHPRRAPDGPFGSRPFFMVGVELDPTRADAFHDWYELDYLPKNVADVPTWTACRRYSSEGRAPQRHLAIYESADLAALDASLDMMRAPFRLDENMAWKRWDTGDRPVITWEDAATYKPIYRRP